MSQKVKRIRMIRDLLSHGVHKSIHEEGVIAVGDRLLRLEDLCIVALHDLQVGKRLRRLGVSNTQGPRRRMR